MSEADGIVTSIKDLYYDVGEEAYDIYYTKS